jgi:hypothetical protein
MHKNQKQKARAKGRRQAARKAARKDTRQTITVWGPDFFTKGKQMRELGFEPLNKGKDGVKNPSGICDGPAQLVTYGVPKRARMVKWDYNNNHMVEITEIIFARGVSIRIVDNWVQWSQVTIDNS